MHLPLRALGYAHVPREVFYDADFAQHALCDGSGEDERCANAHAQPNPFTSADEHKHYFGEMVGLAACNRSAALAASRRQWGAQPALRGDELAVTPRPHTAAAGGSSVAGALVLAVAAVTLAGATFPRAVRRVPRLV